VPCLQAPADQDLLKGASEFHRILQYPTMFDMIARLSSLKEQHAKKAGSERPVVTMPHQANFIMASRFVATHSFNDACGSSRLVPLAINFNHDVEARSSAHWYWEMGEDVLCVVARRDIVAGEEITISYGLRSNAQLFALYGFTLPPIDEPVFTLLAASVAEFLPHEVESKDLNMRVHLTTLPLGASEESAVVLQQELSAAVAFTRHLQEFLRRAIPMGRSAEQSLELLVTTLSERYMRDPVIAEFVEGLRQERLRSPRSCAWWAEMDLPVGSWRSDVVRMKMSEYLCLVTYREALELRSGGRRAAEALPQAVALPLIDAIVGSAAMPCQPGFA